MSVQTILQQLPIGKYLIAFKHRLSVQHVCISAWQKDENAALRFQTYHGAQRCSDWILQQTIIIKADNTHHRQQTLAYFGQYRKINALFGILFTGLNDTWCTKKKIRYDNNTFATSPQIIRVRMECSWREVIFSLLSLSHGWDAYLSHNHVICAWHASDLGYEVACSLRQLLGSSVVGYHCVSVHW